MSSLVSRRESLRSTNADYGTVVLWGKKGQERGTGYIIECQVLLFMIAMLVASCQPASLRARLVEEKVGIQRSDLGFKIVKLLVLSVKSSAFSETLW